MGGPQQHRSTAGAVVAVFAVFGLLGLPTAARAELSQRRMCVFDPAGASGDFYRVASDFQVAALDWGVRFDLQVQTDEKVVMEELKAGRCHAALMTGTRARAFNRFTGTIEAIGALPSYEHLEDVVRLLGSPKAGDRMRNGQYETLGVFPAGHLYLLVNDRKIASVEALAGKRIATFQHDAASRGIIETLGGAMVPAEVSTFAGMFKNGSVDVCYSPVTAIEPLELLLGLRHGGAVVRYPVAQITLQILAREDAGLPAGFSDSSRAWAARVFRRLLELPQRAEAKLPEERMLDLPPVDLARYEVLFRDVRLLLRDREVYDPTMLRLMRRVRCKRNPAHGECAEKVE